MIETMIVQTGNPPLCVFASHRGQVTSANCYLPGGSGKLHNLIWDIPKAVPSRRRQRRGIMPRSTFSPAFKVMARALIAARGRAGLKQSDLAERLGRPQSFVSKMERGERRIDLIEFIVVARALDADAVTLLNEVPDAIPSDTKL